MKEKLLNDQVQGEKKHPYFSHPSRFDIDSITRYNSNENILLKSTMSQACCHYRKSLSIYTALQVGIRLHGWFYCPAKPSEALPYISNQSRKRRLNYLGFRESK